tara:strand:+ start:307 stop:906 length:600 start_codon:yes stop_codon:yes gene_type:complete
MKSNNEDQLHVEEDEKHLLLDHDYDGIQELNHPLPRWWNIIFYVAIVYGIGYWTYYTFMDGLTLREELVSEMEPISQAQADYKRLTEAFNQQVYDQWNTKENLELVKTVYEDNCLACHEEGGKGDVGPNLTDNYWLISQGTPETNYNVVYYGSEENGMPAWGEVLSSEEIYQAIVYVNSIKNTNHPEGKEPQGEVVVEE